MGVPSLARGLDRHPLIASDIIERHRREYPRFWQWRENVVQVAMLDRRIESVFGWPLRISTSPNKRTLYNFPMQSGGAEMLRLAAWRLCEAGIVPSHADPRRHPARGGDRRSRSSTPRRSCGRPGATSATASRSASTSTSCSNGGAPLLATSGRWPSEDVGDDHGRAGGRRRHSAEGSRMTKYVIRNGRRIEVRTIATPATPRRRRSSEAFAKVPLEWAAKRPRQPTP